MNSSSPATPAVVKLSLLKKIGISVLSLFLVLYLFIWIFSPILLRHFAAEPLQNMQVSLADSSSVRFNPFTSTLSIKDLAVLDNKQQVALTLASAEISVHLHRLVLSQLYVSEFNVNDLFVNIIKNEQSFIVAGIDLTNNEQSPASETPLDTEATNDESESTFELLIPQLLLKKITANVNIDGISQQLVLNTLSISNSTISQSKQNIDLSIDAAVNKAALSLHSKLNLIDLQGKIDSQISLTNFALASISPMLAAQGIELAGSLSLSAAPLIELSETQVKLSSKALSLALDNLSLQSSPFLIKGDGHHISVNDLFASASLNGELENASLDINTHFKQGNVSIQNAQNSLVNWQQVNIDTHIDMLADKASISIPSISIDGLNVSQDLSTSEPTALLALQNLALSNINFADNILAIENIVLSGLNANITVNEDKTIKHLVDTSALKTAPQENAEPASQTDTTEPVKSDPASVIVKLNNFALADSGQVSIQDNSVRPAFHQTLVIEKLQAGPFDTSQTTAQTPFAALVIDDNYLKIDVTGHVSPFAEKLNAAMVAKISELNLPSVSPYVKDGLGFELKSGQLDVNVEVKITDDTIDGKTHLFMRGIEMSNADEVEKGLLKESKAMPLNAALGLLKDDKGNINLDVPMRGNIDAPSFGVESFLGMILRKAAMSQAKDYLLTTFVPYAQVISVALSGAEYLLKITFEPLAFNTAEASLKAENTQFLSQLALLMKDKPDLQIKTCAIVTYADIGLSEKTALTAEQRAQIKALGDARQTNLKRFLVERDIASNRILYCAPEIDTNLAAQARIELKTD